MKETILRNLQQIEREESVRVLFACESGSRAWGFPSADSDYDIRFIYLHPKEWYLSINLEKNRDVIEREIEGGLDISGWDLRKALQLFNKSNPPLMEWLGSPIIYLEKYGIAEEMQGLAGEFYSPTASAYHYFHMAQGNYRDYLKGDQVWIKKYFYILRPLLAVQWIEKGLGVVPTEFSVLVHELIPEGELKAAIERLIAEKRKGEELGIGPKIPSISNFIEGEMERLGQKDFRAKFQKPSIELLNDLFRQSFDKVWG